MPRTSARGVHGCDRRFGTDRSVGLDGSRSPCPQPTLSSCRSPWPPAGFQDAHRGVPEVGRRVGCPLALSRGTTAQRQRAACIGSVSARHSRDIPDAPQVGAQFLEGDHYSSYACTVLFFSTAYFSTRNCRTDPSTGSTGKAHRDLHRRCRRGHGAARALGAFPESGRPREGRSQPVGRSRARGMGAKLKSVRPYF